MPKPFSRLFLIILMLSVTGCLRASTPVDFPTIVSGEVRIFHGQGYDDERFLTLEEVSSLSAWLKAHPEGWRDTLEVPPHPRAVIVLHFANGQTKSLTAFKRCFDCGNWERALKITANDDTDGVVQVFPSKDFALIQSLIGN